ncbi:MAG: lipopolysaccharide kinase InaA family protein, partial [Gemmatimonadota bacterium]
GRGPVYRLPGDEGGDPLVIRHYWRGGAVAALLGDRYLRVSTPRPVRELWTSVAVRARGVATPKVAALGVYPDGVFYRADLVSVYVPDSVDLAEALFGPEALEGDDRFAAWRAAGRLVHDLHEAGVVHADLNVKNILLRRSAGSPRAYVLDLDRCRVHGRVSRRRRARVLRRFRRSVDKWAERTGRPLRLGEVEAFEETARGTDA